MEDNTQTGAWHADREIKARKTTQFSFFVFILRTIVQSYIGMHCHINFDDCNLHLTYQLLKVFKLDFVHFKYFVFCRN